MRQKGSRASVVRMSDILGHGVRDSAGSWVFGSDFLVQERHRTLFETLSATGDVSSSNSVLESALQPSVVEFEQFSASAEASVSMNGICGKPRWSATQSVAWSPKMLAGRCRKFRELVEEIPQLWISHESVVGDHRAERTDRDRAVSNKRAIWTITQRDSTPTAGGMKRSWRRYASKPEIVGARRATERLVTSTHRNRMLTVTAPFRLCKTANQDSNHPGFQLFP
jgi:hypothetical protein